MKSPLLFSLSFLLSSPTLLALTPEQAEEQTQLARSYVTGDGVAQDFAKAIELLIPAAEAGNLLAKHSLGYMYCEGMGVPVDYKKGLALFTEAAEAGLSRSQEALAFEYFNGSDFVPVDLTKAVYWMEKAAAQGETNATRQLVAIYLTGADTIPADLKQAFYWMEKGATAGDTKLQLELSRRYFRGIDVEKDEAKAISWVKKAADLGDTDAMMSLALMYRDGSSQFAKDEARAYEWAKKASDLNSSKGHHFRALCLLYGRGVEKNEVEAVRYMHKAAELGDTDAMVTLGQMYASGSDGVEVDFKLSFDLMKSAAEAGDADAMCGLTYIYLNGNDVVAEDAEQAFYWAERAAALDFPKGLFNLGIIYFYGLKGVADWEKARLNLEKAADAEMKLAILLLIEMYSSEEHGNEELLQKRLEQYAKLSDISSIEDAKLEAMHELGRTYIQGDGVPLDIKKGLAILTQLAEGGYPLAQLSLSSYYLKPEEGTEADTVKGLFWAETAANAGFRPAINILFNIYDSGYEGVKADENKAFYWLEKGANSGIPHMQVELALRYQHGVGIEVDGLKSFEWLMKAAEQNEPAALRHVAHIYFNGNEVVAQDDALAYEWAKKGAAAGDSVSMNLLGLCYLYAKGTEKNIEEGLRYVRASAEQLHTAALDNLSFYYREGEHGLPVDLEKSFYYSIKSAEQGSVDAMVEVAINYYEGVGVMQDKVQAFEWMQKSAELRDTDAMSNLSVFYREGIGTEVDYALAYQWAERSAIQGNSAGMFNLGVLYVNGLGVEEDMEKGVSLLEKAVELGEKGAYDLLLEIFSGDEYYDIERVEFYKNAAGDMFEEEQD